MAIYNTLRALWSEFTHDTQTLQYSPGRSAERVVCGWLLYYTTDKSKAGTPAGFDEFCLCSC